MPTPKSLRSAPTRTFKDYILTLSVGQNVGLTKVPQEKFLQVGGNAGKSGATAGLSGDTDIGFPFTINGITYKKFNVSVDGWLVLVDPSTTFSISDVGIADPSKNFSISPTFSANHLFFAVWWSNLTNTSDDSAIATEKYKFGIDQPQVRLNPRKFAIQYCNENNSSEGRRLIVKWNSTNSGVNKARIEFEFVLYENGKIEYRYAPKNQLTIGQALSSANEGATIAIFNNGNNPWEFRDFSIELGYEKNRLKYQLGGTISGSYVDTRQDPDTMGYFNAPYGLNLTTYDYWPGQTNSGAVFTFQPPLNLRKILPRQTIKEKDSKLKYDNSLFDDRKSISYKKTIVSYPTLLPRFYANTLPGVELNQNLFSGDIVFTGSIISKNVHDYLETENKQRIQPFSENKLFENDPTSINNSFFTTGSAISEVGEGFNQSLKSKTQIRLSYRVDHKTTMFGASSSIYYFNSKTGRWQYPTASFADGQFDIANPYNDADNNRIVEVDRCFNAFGFNIASGSSNRLTYPYGTDFLVGDLWTRNNSVISLTKKYEKSVQVDSRYSANSDESIIIPINQPFLLEKAVIEIPIEAGPGWFNDKTKCFIPLTQTSPRSPDELNNSITFDVGGPGLTVALFNQVSTGPNKNKRDLILSGTVTHHLDNVAQISISNTPDISAGGSTNWDTYNPDSGYVFQVMPIGFKAYGGTPTAVITGSLKSASNYHFTGSVQLNCTAEISNGLLIKDAFYIAQAYGVDGDADYAKGALDTLFNTEKWQITNIPYTTFGDQTGGSGVGYRYRNIMSINNFGRSCSGFEPSGRSILGKEYVTNQGEQNQYDNPFYLYQDQNTLTTLKNLVDANLQDPDSVIYATSLIPTSKSFTSPYLLLPNDKLVLSITKSRPVFFSTLTSHPWTSGSIQHDIKLNTGSINITLYGSYVSNGKEYHYGSSQVLDSDAIHEVIVGENKP